MSGCRRIGGWALALAAAVIALAVAAGIAWGSQVLLREQGAVSVRASILDAAQQCCAIEGSYPSSLTYLEEHYGLVVNRDEYAITYESYAANVPPAVRVVPR